MLYTVYVKNSFIVGYIDYQLRTGLKQLIIQVSGCLMKGILYIHFHKNLSKKCKIKQIVQKTLLIHVEVNLNRNTTTILLVSLKQG